MSLIGLDYSPPISPTFQDFFPFTRRTPEEFKRHFGAVQGLEEIIEFQVIVSRVHDTTVKIGGLL